MNIQDKSALDYIGPEKKSTCCEHDTWHNAGSVRFEQTDVRTAQKLKN